MTTTTDQTPEQREAALKTATRIYTNTTGAIDLIDIGWEDLKTMGGALLDLHAENVRLREALKSLRSEQISPDEWGIKCVEDHNAIIDAALSGSPDTEADKS